MQLCSDLEMICKREGGGLDPELFSAVDICEGGAIEMSDEVVLIVTGASEEATRGLLLRHPRIAGSEWTWSFELEGE